MNYLRIAIEIIRKILTGELDIDRFLAVVSQRFDIPFFLLKFFYMLLISLVVLAFILVTVLFLIYLLRKVLGFIQTRLGPMRVGRYGWAQTIADAMKLFSKEDIIPAKADRWIFNLAPLIVFVPAYLVYVVIPFEKRLIVKDLNVGIIYLAAVASIAVVGIIMAGWGSNNKYSLLGAMRSAAQIVSYEVPLVLSTIGVIMMAGSFKLSAIVEAQKDIWFFIPQILGFVVFIISAVAEINQIPFDIPEAEGELVAGYHVEYSGMKFGFFFVAEFSNNFVLGAIATTLFLGGWLGPGSNISPAFSIFWFFVKTYAVVFFLMWLRGTLPRVRVDQLMELSWKVLVPLGLLNIILTGLIMTLRR